MNIRPYTDQLRRELRNRWTKLYDSRAGDCRVVTFQQRCNAHRTLELQLWDDGNHRVTFWWRGRMATKPTVFHTVEEMQRAIDIERYRRPAPRSTVKI